MPVEIIDVRDLQEKVKDELNDIFVIDVRTSDELAIASLPFAHHFAMQTIETQLSELPKDKQIICLCHHGMRSLKVANFLVAQGFENVYSVEGGIHAWSTVIDASICKY